jgi:hypothetical protein
LSPAHRSGETGRAPGTPKLFPHLIRDNETKWEDFMTSHDGIKEMVIERDLPITIGPRHRSS